MDIPTDCERLGAVFSGQVEPVVQWVDGPDGSRRPGDQESNAAGVPMWTVHALVISGERPETIGVRVPAPTCPEPTPLTPAAFERLVCTARVNRRTGALATYWAADGIADLRHQGKRPQQHQGEQQPA